MSENRMQRAEMWKYFRNRRLPADKIDERKKDAKEKARKHIKFECIVNGDRLIIGQWRGLGVIDVEPLPEAQAAQYATAGASPRPTGRKTKKFQKVADFVGVYYMTPSGGTNVSTDGDNWCTCKAEYVSAGGWNYYTAWNLYGYKFECVSGADEAHEWIRRHFGDKSWFYEYNDVIDELDCVERHISMQHRMDAEKRRINKWSDWGNSMPPLPDDFEAWAREVAFGGLDYAFGKKDCDTYYCTACGKTHKQKTWKHRGWYECSRTSKKIKIEKVRNHIWRRERLMIIQSHKTVDGTACSIERSMTMDVTWSRDGVESVIYNDCLETLSLDGNHGGGDIVFCYGHGEARTHSSGLVERGQVGATWDIKNSIGFRYDKCYLYPDVSALTGTRYTGIGIDVAAAKGWKLNYENLMCYRDDPRMEYLIKGNFKRLVQEMLSYNGMSANLMDGNNVQEVLGIDGQGVARLRQADGGTYYLAWLREAYMSYGLKRDKNTGRAVGTVPCKIPEATIQFFCDKKISPREVAFALNLGMSFEQVANYIKRNVHGYTSKDIGYCGNNVEHMVINQWEDYLKMCEKLKLDVSRESVYKPKQLKARHDELVDLLNANRIRIEAEEMESKYPDVRPVCKKIKALYEWGDGNYEVIVPEGAADIQREGRKLRHCVGTTDRYYDRISEEESYIVFVRKTVARSQPWYTAEIEPGGAIRQLRTYGDEEGADRAEAKAFLAKWRREIAKRLGQAEREAAEVSREKRLREFEELRRNGNIIRNGKLAGKLLVDVLEKDFKEFNEEAV